MNVDKMREVVFLMVARPNVEVGFGGAVCFENLMIWHSEN